MSAILDNPAEFGPLRLMTIIQGSPAWIAHRAQCFNASDAPAMLGVSTYRTRADLIAEIATGHRPEVSPERQALFDRGHRQEAAARAKAEEIMGEQLYPVTATREWSGVSRLLSASFDGASAVNDLAWEHKLLNAELREALRAGQVPMRYRPQLEHQLIILNPEGGARILFMASSPDECLWTWYEGDPDLRARVLAGWRILEADVARYTPRAPQAPAREGRSPSELPALRVELQGRVLATNLDAFKASALETFRAIKLDLSTDEDFADAAVTVKWCEEVELRLQAAKKLALSQTADIEAVFLTIDELVTESARVRRALQNAVDSRREALKREAIDSARRRLDAYAQAARADCGGASIMVAADFAGAAKNRRTLATLTDAVENELARAKGEIDVQKQRASDNRRALDALKVPAALVPDLAQLLTREPDYFRLTISARMAEAAAAMATPAPTPAPAPAPTWTPVPPVPQEPPPPGREVKLAELHDLLGFPVSATFIRERLGIGGEPVVGGRRVAVVFHASDVARICEGLVAHIQAQARAFERQERGE